MLMSWTMVPLSKTLRVDRVEKKDSSPLSMSVTQLKSLSEIWMDRISFDPYNPN
jgi:hypothetical protein